MDWSNEIFVKLYVRETDDDLVLSWQARALWKEMLTKFDRSGFIPMRRGRRGLAAIVRWPAEVVETAMDELLADGRVRELPDGYFAPNYIPAQEASKSDKLRQRESRERKRAQHMADSLPVTNRDPAVTERDEVSGGDVTNRDRMSLSADPLLCVAGLPARAIPPSTEPAPTPSQASGSQTGDLAGRQALRDELWRELEAARARAAKALGAELRPLPVFDQGKAALAMRILEAGTLERARGDAMHVIRVRELEAVAKNETKWLSGGMFEERSWRTALASSLAEAKRQPARPAAHGPKTLRVQRDDSNDDAPPIRASMRGDNT